MAISQTQLIADITEVMPDGRDSTDMTTLITRAVKDAFAEGARFLWEKTWADITGDGATLRWEVTGEEVVPASPEEQITPEEVTGFIDFIDVDWKTDEIGRIVVEQMTDDTGTAITSGTVQATLSTTTAITLADKVRFHYYRRPILPGTAGNYAPIPERYWKPASYAKLHSYLAQNGMSGEAENHEKWAQFYDAKAEAILEQMIAATEDPNSRLRVAQ